MTKAGGSASAPREAGKSLKDQNRWQLWIVVAANSLFFCGVIQADAIRAGGLRAAVVDAQHLVPAGVALVVATVLNGLLSAEMKSRLVFLRWRHALPGHRAFSKYAARDPRVDLSALEKVHGGSLPSDPATENVVWYRMYKAVENDHAVSQVHRDYLLLRDYTGLSALFLLLYGATGLYAIPSMITSLEYVALLVGQYVVARQAAANYGVRLVTTVMARRAAKEGATTADAPTKRTRSKARKPR